MADRRTGLHHNDSWQAVNKSLERSQLPGLTCKFEIGGHDLYLKTMWSKGAIVRVDLTLARGGDGDGLPASGREVSMEANRFDLARTSLESICKMASDMLMCEAVGIDYVLQDWMGREMYPSGYCPQTESMVKGPLDGAAKIIAQRIDKWRAAMKDKV